MSSQIYQCLVFGSPTDVQWDALRITLASNLSNFELVLDKDVSLTYGFPANFSPTIATVAIFFGCAGATLDEYRELMRLNIPIVPLVNAIDSAGSELPICLKSINALAIDINDPTLTKPAVVALQCLGLLPRQRRVFLSYRRHESREVALQLFETLSARQFEVFLDTHAVAPAEDFQSVLWHRLCDSDVVVMLDTPGYFDSRWTSAEWGRAIAKHISILQIIWPGNTPSRFSALATRVQLVAEEFSDTRLVDPVIDRISIQVEALRSTSIAVRYANLAGELRSAVEALGGSVEGVGQRRGIALKLPSGEALIAYPSVGVPTAVTLHEAVNGEDPRPAVVVYDHVGLQPQWLEHLDWLSNNITTVKWLKSREAGWTLADWPGT